MVASMLLPAELSFDAWLDYLFGPPVGPSGFRESDDWWDEQANPALAVEHLTHLCERPDLLLARYPHGQIDRGLWFLASESGHLRPVLGPPVPWEPRRRGLLAIGSLYAGLFARACGNYLGHLDRGPEPPDPLNSSCYMWWDLFPTWGSREGAQPQSAEPRAAAGRRRSGARGRARAGQRPGGDPAGPALDSVDTVILQVLAETLRLESEPCREGALHGLGHWHSYYPGPTAAIVEAWLGSRPRISPELLQYARNAQAGCVQ
jgi:hypothetical protein